MASIFKKPKSTIKLGYNGMDMSKSIKFTSSVGHLLPVLYDRLDPGDRIDVSCSVFTRTQPLNTPAFTRVTEHVDYFFVPMKLINSFFGDQFFGIQDVGSSLLYAPNMYTGSATKAIGLPTSLPLAYINSLYRTLADDLIGKDNFGAVDEFGVPAVYNMIRLCSMLGYSETVTLSRFSTDAVSANRVYTENPLVNLDMIFAYQRIFSDFYRLSTWTQNNPMSYSADLFVSKSNLGILGPSLPLPSYLHFTKNASSGVQTYQNYNPYGLFCMRYRPWKRDYFTSIEPSPLYESTQNVSSFVYSGEEVVNRSALTKRGLLSASNLSSEVDYETSYMFQSLGNLETPGLIQSNKGLPFSLQGEISPDSESFSLSQLRTLMAWDKLMRVTNSNKKHYINQVYAHYGYAVPRGVSDEVYYLGSQSSRLQIGEVISSATTGSGSDTSGYSVLGELAGRGISGDSSGRRIKFTAPCHGIMMAIYSAVPESDYEAFGIDRLNMYSSITDYYHSAFDNIGMQPLYMREFDARYIGTPTSLGSGENPSFNNPNWMSFMNPRILGWQYRYSEVKSKYDSIHGAFLFTLRNWVTPRNSKLIYSLDNSSVVPFASSGVWSTFYINPSTLDTIADISFLPSGLIPILPHDTLTNESNHSFDYFKNDNVYVRDPLLHNIDFRYYKSTRKSVYGLPNN